MKKETRKRRFWLWLLPVLVLAALTLGMLFFRNPKAGIPVGVPTEEAESTPRSCTVEYGGGRRTVQGETAAELYRLCADAQSRGKNIVPEEAKPETLSLSLYFTDERNPVSGPFCCVRANDSGWFAEGLVYAPPCYAFPAGTFDALLDVLSRNGEIPAPAGERVAGKAVYGLFEEGGVYALQLYSPTGDLIWAYGPGSHEPRVAEEEPGLWSVSLAAGPSLWPKPWSPLLARPSARTARLSL